MENSFAKKIQPVYFPLAISIMESYLRNFISKVSRLRKMKRPTHWNKSVRSLLINLFSSTVSVIESQ